MINVFLWFFLDYLNFSILLKEIYLLLKKIIPICLLIILLHNMLGYYFLMVLKEAEINRNLSLNLQSGDIPDNELLVFPVPIDFYHQPDRKGFEAVEGEFRFEGKFYKMVKQKLENDTLFVYCYNNKEKQKIFSDVSEHTKDNLAGANRQEDKKTGLHLLLIKEYLQNHIGDFSFSLYQSGKLYYLPFQEKQYSIPFDITSPPPDIA